jgi:DNA polymerase alpha subunit A
MLTCLQKLGKNPKDYPNADSMPQVQVALREITRGKTIRVNDVMSYIVTMGDEQTKGLPAPKRSYTPQDVLKAGSGLQPDIEYYLLKQIFPPIERLCAPIPGTDSVRLAECLGLDTRKYQINTSSSVNQQNAEIFPLESQIPESIRFKDVARFTLRCRFCHESAVFDGLCASTAMCSPTGLVCTNSACEKPYSTISIIAQLESRIRAQTSQYYEGWLVCDDPSCGNRTRQISVYGLRCLGSRGRAEGCLGKMCYEYSDKRVYNQLLYFAGLWDVDKAKEKAKSIKEFEDVKERVVVLAESNRAMFGVVKDVVDGYLRKCGRQWVDMGGLFGFAAK